MARILVVEDEPDIALGLEEDLKRQGYQVETVGDGRTALRRASHETWDVILLDVMLPGLDGFEVCRELRRARIRTPIILLTAKVQEAEKVLGLELGADDYVTKPFSVSELMARVRALLRRTKSARVLPDKLRVNDVDVDFQRYEARKSGHPLQMTPKEYGVLRLLAARAGEVLTREELLNEVWGYENFPTTRTVDNHISSLRLKLEKDPEKPRHLLTVHGVGYRLVI
jgi:DNA-binding response OmpR family regulator